MPKQDSDNNNNQRSYDEYTEHMLQKVSAIPNIFPQRTEELCMDPWIDYQLEPMFRESYAEKIASMDCEGTVSAQEIMRVAEKYIGEDINVRAYSMLFEAAQKKKLPEFLKRADAFFENVLGTFDRTEYKGCENYFFNAKSFLRACRIELGII